MTAEETILLDPIRSLFINTNLHFYFITQFQMNIYSEVTYIKCKQKNRGEPWKILLWSFIF